MGKILAHPTTHMTFASCHLPRLLVDACDYYRVFYDCAIRAQETIELAGWQFDSQVELVRGDDAERCEYPTRLLPLLVALCRERPALTVRILAWDYSPVFMLEREWLQGLIFEATTPSNLRFCFDDRHVLGASVHHKLVIVDGHVAFLGGMDLASGRWDDRQHRVENPSRVERGEAQKPYHDTMLQIRGEIVRTLRELFDQRWCQVAKESQAEDSVRSEASLEGVLERGLPIASTRAAISRTLYGADGAGPVAEILALYERAIREARELLYFETQYFTSRALRDALMRRFEDPHQSPLQVVLMMPKGADSQKEFLALGAAQEQVLAELSESAKRHGMQFRVYSSLADGNQGNAEDEVFTFIHSKLLIVDDRLICVGSANLTNRSLQLDNELCVSFEEHQPGGALSSSIRAIRSSLLTEHTGVTSDPEFFAAEGLVGRLDRLAADPKSRLRARAIDESLVGSDRVLHLERVFDPEKPLSQLELDEVVGMQA
jgi:phosphatidylserine/phosphatidylglycerophosphate/cardiolipin synthase-like enzyme